MKLLQDKDGKLSTGRILSFSLFVTCTAVWVVSKVMGKTIDANDMTLIQWGWGIAIAGKVGQKFAEK